MYSIENSFLKLIVNENGGAIKALYDKKNNNNLFYEPDCRSWSGTDAVIFPFVARLKNQKYTVNGIEYSLKNHGVARYETLMLKECSNNRLILELDSNNNLKMIYPFDFHFEIIYELLDNKLSISYLVKNNGESDMYFSVGGHPALKASGSYYDNGFEFDSTKLIFNNTINTKQYVLNETGDLIKNINNVVLHKEIDLKKKLITDSKTLIYDASNINEVRLVTNQHEYIFDIKESEVLAIWTWPGYGDYICIEPWWGIPDMENPNLELKDKPLIHKLASNCIFKTGYSITINEK